MLRDKRKGWGKRKRKGTKQQERGEKKRERGEMKTNEESRSVQDMRQEDMTGTNKRENRV